MSLLLQRSEFFVAVVVTALAANQASAGPTTLLESFSGPSYAFTESGDDNDITTGVSRVWSPGDPYVSNTFFHTNGVSGGSYFRIDGNLGNSQVTLNLDPQPKVYNPVRLVLSLAAQQSAVFESADYLELLVNDQRIDLFRAVPDLPDTPRTRLYSEQTGLDLTRTFKQFSYLLDASVIPDGSLIGISFRFLNNADNEVMGVDNVSLTYATPEPGTLSLLALGGVSVAGGAIRRRRAAQSAA